MSKLKKTQAKKFSDSKPRISDLPLLALKEVNKVGKMGADKYGHHNYRKGRNTTEWVDAAHRHANEGWMLGEDLDPESKIHHLAHAAWNLLTALEQELLGRKDLDDRQYQRSEK